MPDKLPYLVAEINAALEIYLSARTGQQYNRVAFLLCDDIAELASKLFLLDRDPAWTAETRQRRFKGFRTVTNEVRRAFENDRPADAPAIALLLNRIESRRTRRNDFFHSTSLLDLTLHPHDCVNAFCDLLDYGTLLFPGAWSTAVQAAGNMETCELVARLDQKSYSDPGLAPQMNSIFSQWRRTGPNARARGSEVANYAEDLHLRLAIRNGGKALRDRLETLLTAERN